MESYFADQKKRDREYRGKRTSLESNNVLSNYTRKDYMRHYMKKKRESDSFRKHENLKAAERMKKMINTEDGRQKHNKRCAEGMRKILSTEEGREKT